MADIYGIGALAYAGIRTLEVPFRKEDTAAFKNFVYKHVGTAAALGSLTLNISVENPLKMWTDYLTDAVLIPIGSSVALRGDEIISLVRKMTEPVVKKGKSGAGGDDEKTFRDKEHVTTLLSRVTIEKLEGDLLYVDKRRVTWTGMVVTRRWNIWAKLSIEEDKEILDRLYLLCVLYVPSETTVTLQPDAHAAGSIVLIGFSASWIYDDRNISIPLVLISADIGCGINMMPLVDTSGTQVKLRDLTLQQRVRIMMVARHNLKRTYSEEDHTISPDVLRNALTFIGLERKFLELLEEFKMFLVACKKLRSDEDALSYVCKYMLSIGSAGNHFVEIGSDPDDNCYLFCHSGSRKLGADVYTDILAAAGSVTYALTNNQFAPTLAVGPVARLYASVHDFLVLFATVNRNACGQKVLLDSGFQTDPVILFPVMCSHRLFTGLDMSTTRRLLLGIVHNGMHFFIDKVNKRYFVNYTKGACIVSRRQGVVLTALRQGDGVLVSSVVDPEALFEETTYQELETLIRTGEFTQVLDFATIERHFVTQPHGAGRAKSTTQNFRDCSSLFPELGSWIPSHRALLEFQRRSMPETLIMISSNSAGDHPDGYKRPEQICDKFALAFGDSGREMVQFRTIIGHKEGLAPSYSDQLVHLAITLLTEWRNLTPLEKLMFDPILLLIYERKPKNRFFKADIRKVVGKVPAYTDLECLKNPSTESFRQMLREQREILLWMGVAVPEQLERVALMKDVKIAEDVVEEEPEVKLVSEVY